MSLHGNSGYAGLSYDFKAPDYGILALEVFKKFFSGFIANIVNGELCSFQYVKHVFLITLYRPPLLNI